MNLMAKAAEIRDLSFAYSGAKTVLRRVSFSVERGEALVIAGLSGCGKTTLCHILAGIIPRVIPGKIEGEVKISGESIASLPLSQIALKAGLVFQDADAQIIAATVEDELAFGLENLCVDPGEIRRRVEETMEFFNLSALREMNPAWLSGGQKRLLSIAGALILNPPLLILDEPMNALDKDGRALIQNIIKRERDNGRALIIVEHDLKLTAGADRCLILEEGSVAALEEMKSLLAKTRQLRAWGLLA